MQLMSLASKIFSEMKATAFKGHVLKQLIILPHTQHLVQFISDTGMVSVSCEGLKI